MGLAAGGWAGSATGGIGCGGSVAVFLFAERSNFDFYLRRAADVTAPAEDVTTTRGYQIRSCLRAFDVGYRPI